MVTRHTTIQNEFGIHCRPSAVIIKAVRNYKGRLIVRFLGDECDPRSILGLMSLGLKKGDEIEIEVSGEDAERVADELAELFARQFDFPGAGKSG